MTEEAFNSAIALQEAKTTFLKQKITSIEEAMVKM